MFCPQCGTEQVPGANYCSKCGLGLNPVATKSLADFRRPAIVTLLAVLAWIAGGLWLIGGSVLLATLAADTSGERAPLAIGGVFVLGVSAYQIGMGVGLWRMKPSGRILQIIAACIGLLGIPIGTLISIAILVYMFKPGVKLLFSKVRERTLTAEELKQVEAATSSQAATVVVAVVAVCLVLIFLVGIIAAIAVPGLLRARIAGNEAVAIGTLRAIGSAEATYAANNGGYFDSVSCLSSPSNCLPGHSGPSFLAENYTQRSGYVFEYRAGRTPYLVSSTVSKSSVESFTVMAVPVSAATGTRRFCLDASLQIRASSDLTSPVTEARCPSAWARIE